MSATKKYIAVSAFIVIFGLLVFGCDTDSSYEQRAAVYVSNINEGGGAFFCDVLNQGDTLYIENSSPLQFQTEDDYVQEDYIKVEFTNTAYSGLVDVDNGVLSDFLVTSYRITYEPLNGDPIPVQSFRGETSVLVPANSTVEAVIMLVPFEAKNQVPLQDLRYAPDEILSNARIVFSGHEVRTEYNYSFEAGLMVNFGDELTVDEGGN